MSTFALAHHTLLHILHILYMPAMLTLLHAACDLAGSWQWIIAFITPIQAVSRNNAAPYVHVQLARMLT